MVYNEILVKSDDLLNCDSRSFPKEFSTIRDLFGTSRWLGEPGNLITVSNECSGPFEDNLKPAERISKIVMINCFRSYQRHPVKSRREALESLGPSENSNQTFDSAS